MVVLWPGFIVGRQGKYCTSCAWGVFACMAIDMCVMSVCKSAFGLLKIMYLFITNM